MGLAYGRNSMTVSSGLYFILRKLLDAKTKTEADAYISEYVGNDYLKIAREVLGRISFDRTKKQNKTVHGYFGQIAKQTGEDPLDVKNRAKYQIGLPILLRDDPSNEAKFKRVLGHLDYQERIKAMEVLTITSIMTTKQLTEFMDTFERQMRSEGFQLTVPEEA